MNSSKFPSNQDETSKQLAGEISQSVLDSLSDLVAVVDPNGTIYAVNKAWSNSHLAANACSQMNYLSVCRKAADQGDELAAAALQGINSVLDREEPSYTAEYTCHEPDGEKRWYLMRVTPLAGNQAGAVITHTDITSEKIAQAHQHLIATVFDTLCDGVLILDQDFRVLTANQAYLDISGYSSEECLGKHPPHWHLQDGSFQQAWSDALDHIEQYGQWQGEHLSVRRDGERFDESLTVSKTLAPTMDEPRFVWVMRDTTIANSMKQRLQILADSDQLTGLLNRDAVARMLTQELEKNASVAVAVLDIDGFTDINVTLGHQAGNALLKRLADRLQKIVPQECLIARSGADEFICALLTTGSTTETEKRIRNLQKALSKPYQVSRHQVHVTLSVGLASSPDDGKRPDALFQNAYMALTQARRKGRGTVACFDPGLSKRAAENLFMANNLHQAIEQGQLHLNLQPRARTTDNSVTGFEALVRWHHPDQGRIPPADFIRVAEETGLIHELGQWVLESALSLLGHLNQLDLWKKDWRLAINISGRQFKENDFVDGLFSLLEDNRVSPEQIELEITEGVLMEEPERCKQMLQELRRRGVCIAVDDFGTGYSSLYYLKHFALDILKIDQCFVSGLPDSTGDLGIVRAILAMAQSLGLEVIAEGVETQAQCNLLADLGCDQIQGYLLSRPSKPEIFFPGLKR